MPRIVVELTNRCNLACAHCFSGRHGGGADLPLEALDEILARARHHGFDHLTFTGGDPTVYRWWDEALERTASAGYAFSLVTNGINLPRTHVRLLPWRERLRQLTISLDGATAATHDALRGAGAFRKALAAMSVCTAVGLPFSTNMVVTRHNRSELAELVALAARMGSRGVRFGHLMPSPRTTAMGFDLDEVERDLVDAEIALLRRGAPIPVGVAPGGRTADPFPCAPLHLEEINVDHRGRLSKCCHLSSHGGGVEEGDVAGDLLELGFDGCLRLLREEHERFRAEKLARLREARLRGADFHPCWYCSESYGKTGWLDAFPDTPWGRVRREAAAARAASGAGAAGA